MNKETAAPAGSRAEISVAGKTLRFGGKTYIMGILNVTPDSFSDGGDFIDLHAAAAHAGEMLAQGADIIDVGGESTRPGFSPVPEAEEAARIVPVIKRLSDETDAVISVDTTKASVARLALESGAHIVNDIWGLQKDREMARIAADFAAPVILMHNHEGTSYEGDLIAAITDFLLRSVEIALDAGIPESHIILDPGIGFGKNAAQNMEVMARLGEICRLGYPVLLGASRKSMIGNILGVPPKERVYGTVATTVLAIAQGVDIVRVHDVRANADAAKVADAIVRRR